VDIHQNPGTTKQDENNLTAFIQNQQTSKRKLMENISINEDEFLSTNKAV
jgi:hypothetical protein